MVEGGEIARFGVFRGTGKRERERERGGGGGCRFPHRRGRNVANGMIIIITGTSTLR